MQHLLTINHGDSLTLSLTGAATFTLNVEFTPPDTIPTPPARWRLPVNPAHQWTTLRGNRHNPKVHTGYDINLNVAPWGNGEATLGLGVYAIGQGIVYYVAQVAPGWGAGGIVVLHSIHDDRQLWTRYVHINPTVSQGDVVAPGDGLGYFVAHPSGSYLHFDMARNAIKTHWLTAGIDWVDPREILSDIAGDFFSV